MNDREAYAGMTINKHLFAAGLLDTFDQAESRRDRAEMIRILESVEVPDADKTVDALLGS